ncbi:CobW family GTP-binding protein [Yinghuangia sp. ASG 101]|uniref:GTP-binding protein n=1 Tax=Yinghuangia sp. ASG 101 TaxID=2896848 RepID=UPI001E4ADC70|nr:GTP-binding protein [Yinghuangia sp. ASG 101]UGQ13952.1 CobW family GTP-binding protein [Yinghuangia sp. ASG 101]
MPSEPPLPVALLTGLHAEARRATGDRLLAEVPRSVLIHQRLTRDDAGRIELVVRDASGVLERLRMPLANDCVCCGIREDVLPRLRHMAASRDFRLAVIETWDSVEPQEAAEAIAEHAGDRLRLAAVIAAVAPDLLVDDLARPVDLAELGLASSPDDHGTVAEVLARQIEYATVLAYPPDGGRDEAVGLALMGLMHPAATLLPLDASGLDSLTSAAFDTRVAASRVHPACSLLPYDDQDAGVVTAVWRRRRPAHPGRLYDALADVVPAALRSRGRLWLASRPDDLLAWEAAGGSLSVESAGLWLASLTDTEWDAMPPLRQAAAAVDWDPLHGDRGQHLCFTAPDLDREPLFELLDSCLLTDDEYTRGPDHWRSLADPFAEFLDDVAA